MLKPADQMNAQKKTQKKKKKKGKKKRKTPENNSNTKLICRHFFWWTDDYLRFRNKKQRQSRFGNAMTSSCFLEIGHWAPAGVSFTGNSN